MNQPTRRQASRRAAGCALPAIGLLLLAGCTTSGKPSARTASTATATSSTVVPTPSSSAPESAATTSSAPATAASSAGTTTPATTPTTSAAPPPGTLVVTYSAWNSDGNDAEVAGYVPGRQVPPGICTLRLTQDGQTVQASRTATADVRTTDCGTLTIPGGQVANGTWTGSLSYRSTGGPSASAPVTIKVVR